MVMGQTTTTYSSHTLSGRPDQNVRIVLLRYLRHWPWFLLSVTLALGVGYVYLLYKQPIYRSQASLLLLEDTLFRGRTMRLSAKW